jgi:hypothetical protein
MSSLKYKILIDGLAIIIKIKIDKAVQLSVHEAEID